MSEDAIWILAIGGWVLIAAIITGVWREVTGKWPESEAGPISKQGAIVFWPVMAVAFAIIGIVNGTFWVISQATWLGRGPAKLVKWLLSRKKVSAETSNFPTAKVIK